MEIETERLLLRPFAPADAADLHRLWTLPDMRRYLWDDRVIAPEETTAQVAHSVCSFEKHGFGFWTVVVKEMPVLAGFSGLRLFGDPPEVEVLYGLDPAYWGVGLATEAARAVLRFGFETRGVERIYAGADPPNAASFRVMERLGMSFAKRAGPAGAETIYYAVSRGAFRYDESYYAIRGSDG